MLGEEWIIFTAGISSVRAALGILRRTNGPPNSSSLGNLPVKQSRGKFHSSSSLPQNKRLNTTLLSLQEGGSMMENRSFPPRDAGRINTESRHHRVRVRNQNGPAEP